MSGAHGHICFTLEFVMVGALRFELRTPCSQSKCATRLRHAPTLIIIASAFCNSGLSVESPSGASRTCGSVRILEELGGFDRLNFDYSQNAEKTDALASNARSHSFPKSWSCRCDTGSLLAHLLPKQVRYQAAPRPDLFYPTAIVNLRRLTR